MFPVQLTLLFECCGVCVHPKLCLHKSLLYIYLNISLLRSCGVQMSAGSRCGCQTRGSAGTSLLVTCHFWWCRTIRTIILNHFSPSKHKWLKLQSCSQQMPGQKWFLLLLGLRLNLQIYQWLIWVFVLYSVISGDCKLLSCSWKRSRMMWGGTLWFPEAGSVLTSLALKCLVPAKQLVN